MRPPPRPSSFRPLIVLLWALGLLVSAGCGGSADPGESADSLAETADDEATARRPKVAIFGVDGATFTVMRPLIEAGRLPHMAGIIERGTGIVLRKPSRYDASPVLWNTILTGTMPETHGILNFGKMERGALSIYASSDRRVPALWNLVTSRGGSAGIVGLWNTWPAEDIRGYVVSDRFPHTLFLHQREGRIAAADWGITHPAELHDELSPFVRPPEALDRSELETLGTFSDAEWEEMVSDDKNTESVLLGGLAALKFGWQAQETLAAASLYLLRTREQPDLFITFLELPDRVGHQFWHAYAPHEVSGGAERVEAEWRERWAEIVPRAYERTDWWIGRMLAELDEDTTVLVVSDHGMQSSGRAGGRMSDLASVGGSGWHHDEGILLAAGPAIRRGAVARATILDVAPLTMVALGLPGSTQFEGHLLRPLIDPDFLRAYPPSAPLADDYVAPELPAGVDPSQLDEDFIRHLTAIGYTDGSDQLLADVLDGDEDGRDGGPRRAGRWAEPCRCCVHDAPEVHCVVEPECDLCGLCPACATCAEHAGG